MRGPGVSIFLYVSIRIHIHRIKSNSMINLSRFSLQEQVIGILFNMSGNKKCHSHLSNSHIIHFITHVFQSKFHETYPSRAENDSHRRTIKTILHILTRLIHDSSVGQEILENHFLPIFAKIDAKHSFSFTGSLNEKDLSFITKQMNETINQKLSTNSAAGISLATGGGGSAANNKIKFNISRQESYVWVGCWEWDVVEVNPWILIFKTWKLFEMYIFRNKEALLTRSLAQTVGIHIGFFSENSNIETK